MSASSSSSYQQGRLDTTRFPFIYLVYERQARQLIEGDMLELKTNRGWIAGQVGSYRNKWGRTVYCLETAQGERFQLEYGALARYPL